MKFIGIIPSRYDSTRFPGKPLALIHGKPMIQHVYENALKSNQLNDLIVATDDQRIMDCVKDFNGKSILTSSLHNNGTERCAEVIENMDIDYDFAINIQGDEPFLNANQIDELIVYILNTKDVQIATQIKEITDKEQLTDTNIVKAIPFDELTIVDFQRFIYSQEIKPPYYKHIGMYAYKSETLSEIVRLNRTFNEVEHRLEQLRWLDNNYPIHYQITQHESDGINHPIDLEKYH